MYFPWVGVRPILELWLYAHDIKLLNKSETKDKDKITKSDTDKFKNHWYRFDQVRQCNTINIIEARNVLIDSIAPQLYGRSDEKLGLLLSMIGGVPINGKSRIRGKIHILFVGDPGTGKSQLLRYAQKINSRSVMTSGVGTTGAGLTVSWFREQSEFVLEAGALVLADTGIWCIDEFGRIKKDDRASIHEAMEQQTISVAKGGIVCKINTRVTIVAACNRIQGKEENPDLSISTGIISSLLSRFDLIYLMPDEHNVEVDSMLADYWLYKFSIAFEKNEDLWPIELMNKYVMFVSDNFDPILSDSVEILFKSYYIYIKQCPIAGKERKTVRFLESLIRLAQAHSRLMFRTVINTFDGITAILLMEYSMSTGLIRENFIHTRYSSKSLILLMH